MSKEETFFKSNDEIMLSIKKNLVRMLMDRGFINKKNYEKIVNTIVNNNKEEFVINIDNDRNYNTLIENKEIIIKIFNYSITSTAKDSEIYNFISKNLDKYVIIIAKEINNKSKTFLKLFKNKFLLKNKIVNFEIEFFNFFELSFIVVDHILQPYFFPVDINDEKQFLEEYNTVKKKNMSRILVDDPVSKYYNLKPTNIVKIIRTTDGGLCFSYSVIM
jgi:DNA-directed RNA polymerase subunit H (RpoH/RPB5)